MPRPERKERAAALVAQLREHAQSMRNAYAEYGDASNINGLLGTEKMCDEAADELEHLNRHIDWLCASVKVPPC